MKRLHAFTQIDLKFLNDLKYRRIALDASFLIKVFFDGLIDHKIHLAFADKLHNSDVALVANATVKSELLEFARRVALTHFFFYELNTPGLKFPKALINTMAKLREKKEGQIVNERKDAVLNDFEIKEIRDSLIATQGISSISKWSQICEVYLTGRIQSVLAQLESGKVKYLSYDDLKEKNLLEPERTLQWSHAVKVCESAGIGFWDSMLINFTETAQVDAIVSLDRDLAYAYATSDLLKKSTITSDKILSDLSGVRL